MALEFQTLREHCVEANRLLPACGLVDLTFGNVSVADPVRRVFAIKPSGVEYDALVPADIPVLDYDGKIVAGSARPSSDTETHRRLLLAFEGVCSVVHTHSRNAVAFAQAGIDLPCVGTTHADYFFGDIPVTRPLSAQEVSGEYEWETGNVIVERLRGIDPLQMPAALVAGHGPFAWGESGRKAVEVAQALEIIADLALKTLALRPDAPGLPDHVLAKHHFRKHGPGAYYGQPG